MDVGSPEVDFAVERAIQRAQQSVTEAYLRAETVGAGAARVRRSPRTTSSASSARPMLPPTRAVGETADVTSCP